MKVLIRIAGDVGLKREIRETLHNLRLRRKYSCVAINPTKEQEGMIKKLRDFIAFGEISEEMHKKLIKARGKKDSTGKLKPFFRLHPPRKGIKSKLHFPKGVLGNHNEKINELLERML